MSMKTTWSERVKTEAWEMGEDFRHWKEDGENSRLLIGLQMAWAGVAMLGCICVFVAVLIAYKLGAAGVPYWAGVDAAASLSLVAGVGVVLAVYSARRLLAMDDQIRARRAPCAHRTNRARVQTSSP